MTAANDTPRAIRIVGGAGTGKTETLVCRAAGLVSSGVAPADVRAFCATPSAARAFAVRLREKLGEAGGEARVVTPRAFALEVLGDVAAVRFTGREPRPLADFEEKFLLEDMKVSGLRPKRLREMLKFFHRSWTELADDDESWLLPGEEAETHALLKANLAFTRSIVEPEAANLAVRFLRANTEARAAHGAKHVVADDWQCLSRASQLLCELAAAESIAVTGDADACVETFDSYPYAAGLDEFAERHPQAETIELTTCYRSSSAEELAADDPADEFAKVADMVAAELAAGTEPGRMAVSVPNGVWAKNVVAALKARKVAAEALPDALPIRGDIRDNARCQAARLMTALALVADPDDALAWRCWCGYGDYLANSAAFADLRSYAENAGLGLVQALEAMVCDSRAAAGVIGAERVVEAYRAGRELIERTHGLAGRELLDELARATGADAVPPAVAALCEGGETAQEMARLAREQLLFPALRDEAAVAVVPYDRMTGLSPEVLAVAGFVNGFIPCRDYFDAAVTPLDKQKKMRAVDASRVYALAGKAGRRLVLSHFAETDLETAGALDLKIDRIKLKNGIRTCSISPSDFLATLMA